MAVHVEEDSRTRTAAAAGLEPSLVLQARGLWFSYNSRLPVLRGVGIDLHKGEVAMVLGRSGSGKTTLLRVLKGLLRPQRGTVREFKNGDNGTRGRGLAYVPQTLGLVRSLTALDNAVTGAISRVGTARSLLHAFPRDILEEARELIARLGIASKLHEPVYRLSGGERQRVAIARALMQRPSLILADEFVSQLDPITAEDILGMMRDIASERNVSLLITTHETDIVEAYADRVIVMREGRIVHDSPRADISAAGLLQILR
jgi:phosphonate transport system ATP-binding protein